jgi:hypothetical protein
LGHAMSIQAHPRSRTWDGWRWLFVLFSALFAAIGVWLGFSGPSSSAALLIAIPAVFALGSLAVALFASDARLQRIATFFLAFS